MPHDSWAPGLVECSDAVGAPDINEDPVSFAAGLYNLHSVPVSMPLHALVAGKQYPLILEARAQHL